MGIPVDAVFEVMNAGLAEVNGYYGLFDTQPPGQTAYFKLANNGSKNDSVSVMSNCQHIWSIEVSPGAPVARAPASLTSTPITSHQRMVGKIQ